MVLSREHAPSSPGVEVVQGGNPPCRRMHDLQPGIPTSIPRLLHREPDLASLPRPNQFVGLERINFTKHPFPEVTIPTFAGVIAPIDRDRPNFVYPPDPRRRSTYFGTVSPDDRNVLATNQACLIPCSRCALTDGNDRSQPWCNSDLVISGWNGVGWYWTSPQVLIMIRTVHTAGLSAKETGSWRATQVTWKYGSLKRHSG